MTVKNRKIPVNALAFICVAILFLILEAIENFLPTWEIPIILVKALTSLIPFGLAFYGTLKQPNFQNIGFTSVLFTYLIGDILIRINFTSGVIAFFIANLLISGIFLKIGKFSIFQLFVYLISLVVVLIGLIIFKEPLGTTFYPILIYAFIVIFMMVSSFKMSFSIRLSAIIFFISDLLLGIGLAGFKNPILSFISLGLYYLAISILANVVYKNSTDQRTH